MTDLRTLALAATPGPWMALIDNYDAGTMFVTSDPRHGQEPVANNIGVADAAFIAAASPAVVLALLDVVDAARGDHLSRHGGSPLDEAMCMGPACVALRAALARYEEVTRGD